MCFSEGAGGRYPAVTLGLARTQDMEGFGIFNLFSCILYGGAQERRHPIVRALREQPLTVLLTARLTGLNAQADACLKAQADAAGIR